MVAHDAKASAFRKAAEGFLWDGVAHLPYKDSDSAPFKAISRQTLFSDPRLLGELRYFEIEPGGFSTLERHEHMHAVMALRGRGRCLVGDEVHALQPYDLVTIEPWVWHQFRAGADAPLGFCALSTPRGTGRNCRRSRISRRFGKTRPRRRFWMAQRLSMTPPQVFELGAGATSKRLASKIGGACAPPILSCPYCMAHVAGPQPSIAAPQEPHT